MPGWQHLPEHIETQPHQEAQGETWQTGGQQESKDAGTVEGGSSSGCSYLETIVRVGLKRIKILYGMSRMQGTNGK